MKWGFVLIVIIATFFGLGGCAGYSEWVASFEKPQSSGDSVTAPKAEVAKKAVSSEPKEEALFESDDEDSPDEPEEMMMVDELAAGDEEKSSGKRLDKKRIVVKYDNPDCRYEDEGDTAKGRIRIIAGAIEGGLLLYGAAIIANADEVATIPEALRGKRAYDLIAEVCLSQSERGRTLSGVVPETQYVAIVRIRLISAADNLVLVVGEGRFSFNAVSGDPTTAYISAARTAVEKIR